ncbi:MAG: TRAP transporter substrate-binding protein DctP [Treponema sp.]|jgi:TRAP-type C4-dicarboxylate transport system substrate-binding protein|nr:TRAP transporter substrate-binding protein DctP [Treponema sp.]
MIPQKKFFRVLILFLILTVCIPFSVFAQRRKVVLKIASLVPENTAWGQALNAMSREWSTATNGNVELVIYHGGIVGEEADVVRKLRLNQIQGAVLTSLGINLISPDVMSLSAPFLIRNDEELTLALDTFKPELDANISKAGFYMLAWAKAGWVRIFSRNSVLVPADLKRQKVAAPPTTPELIQAFKTMGYQVVPLGYNDMLVGLNSGAIDAVYLSPVYVGALQLFGTAKHMTTLNLAPILGSIVLNQRGWRAVPDEYKPRLIEITRNIERNISSSIQSLENDAIKTMINYGLITHDINASQEQLWYADMERALPSLLGTTFDRNLYNRIGALLQRYRTGQ